MKIPILLPFISLFSITLTHAQWQPNGATSGNIYYNSGNVGIGTTTPDQALVVNGCISFNYGDNNSYSGFRRNGIKTEYYNIITSVNSNVIHEFTGTNQTIMSLTQGGNIGIGTTNPLAGLHLEGEGNFNTNLWLGKAFINNSNYHFDRARVGISGTSDSGQFGAGIHFQVRNQANTNYLHAIVGQSREGRIIFETGGAGVVPPTERMTILSSGDVGIGTTAPDAKLTVKGDVHAEEVRVDLNVPAPDYVFAEDYDLSSLESISAYIQANQHLPEVPSAEEMEENGIDIGVMNMLLLKKVEELTLYILDQNKRILSQNIEIQSQNKKIISLEKEIENLKSYHE